MKLDLHHIKQTMISIIHSNLRTLMICLTALSLCGCLMDGTPSWDSTSTENDSYFTMQSMPNYESTEGYNTSYDSYLSLPDTDTSPGVVVPKTYHLGNYTNTPPTSKDEDRQWVNQQNPSGYTIEVSKDVKPAPVANKLQQMPKNERSVEVRSQSGSYLGLHGSYPNREAAEQQLNNLPSSVKDNAQIKNWHSIQNQVDP